MNKLRVFNYGKVAAPPAGRGGPGGGRSGRGPIGGPGTSNPSRLHFPSTALKSLLVYAYAVKPYQITGPAFLDSERYDGEGRIAPGVLQAGPQPFVWSAGWEAARRRTRYANPGVLAILLPPAHQKPHNKD